MTTDFNNKQLIRNFIYSHLSLKNPEKTLKALEKVIPNRILDHIKCIEKDREIILITNETWLSWLKTRHHQIKQCLPNGSKLIISNIQHEPLERVSARPTQLTLSKEDAEDLVKLSEKQKNPKLQAALKKLAQRKLNSRLL